MIIREFAAVLGLTLDAPSFKDGTRALANVAAQLKDQQAKVSRNPLLNAGILGDGVGKAKVGGLVEGFEAVGGAVYSVASKVYNAFSDISQQVSQLSTHLGKVGAGAGESAQRIQGLSFASGRAGIDLGQLGATLQDLQAKQYATKFSGDAILAWSRLGVSVREASGKFKPAAQLFEDSVSALINVKEPAERTGRALATVGQAGLDAANYWRTRGGIAAFREAAKEVALFGAELSEVDRDAIGNFSVSSSRLGLVMQGLKNSIAGPLYGALASVAGQFVDWVKTQKGTNDGLRDSVSQLGKLGPSLLAVGKAAYTYLVPALGTLVEVLAGLGNVVGNVVGFAIERIVPAFQGLGTVGVVAAGAVFAAFFPLSAIFLGIAAVIEDLIVYSQGGSSITGRAIAAFADFKAKLGDESWLGEGTFGIRVLKQVANLLLIEIPDAIKYLAGLIRDVLVGAFNLVKGPIDKVNAQIDDMIRRIEKVDGRGPVTDFLRNPFGAPEDVIRGLEASRALPTRSAVPTVPVGTYSPGAAPGGGGGVAGQSVLPPITIQQTFSGGNIGSLKEVREIAKNASEEGLNEAFLSISRSIPG